MGASAPCCSIRERTVLEHTLRIKHSKRVGRVYGGHGGITASLYLPVGRFPFPSSTDQAIPHFIVDILYGVIWCTLTTIQPLLQNWRSRCRGAAPATSLIICPFVISYIISSHDKNCSFGYMVVVLVHIQPSAPSALATSVLQPTNQPTNQPHPHTRIT
jgi:hypothetical protein